MDTQGVDVGLNFYVADGWSLNFAYSWFDFEIQDQAPGDPLLLPTRRSTSSTAGLTYTGADWGFGIAEPLGGRVPLGRRAVPGQRRLLRHDRRDGELGPQRALGLRPERRQPFDDEHCESFGGDLLERRALGSVTFNW